MQKPEVKKCSNLVGSIFTNREDLSYKVIRKTSSDRYDIQFLKSKKVIKDVISHHIKKGVKEDFIKKEFRDYSKRVGEVYTNRKGQKYKIIDYNPKNHHCDIEFLDDGIIIKNLSYNSTVKLGFASKMKATKECLKNKIFDSSNGNEIKVLKELPGSMILFETEGGVIKSCKKNLLIGGLVSDKTDPKERRGRVYLPVYLVEGILKNGNLPAKLKKELEEYYIKIKKKV